MKALLRSVNLGTTGYSLKVWEDHFQGNRLYCRYQFRNPEGVILFQGNEYSAGFGQNPASDDSLRGLIGFFLVGEYDVEADYFDNYSPEALKFRDSQDRESLLWGFGTEDNGDLEYMNPADWPFIDVE